MNKSLSKNLRRYLCLTVTIVLSVSVSAQKDFSSIQTGVDVGDAKIIESGLKSFEEIERGVQTALMTTILSITQQKVGD